MNVVGVGVDVGALRAVRFGCGLVWLFRSKQPDQLLMSTGGTSMYQLCSSSNWLVRNDIIETLSRSLLAYESVWVFWSVWFGFHIDRFGVSVCVPEQPERLLMSTGRRSMYQLCCSSNLLVGNDVIGASMFSLSAYESVRVFRLVRFD